MTHTKQHGFRAMLAWLLIVTSRSVGLAQTTQPIINARVAAHLAKQRLAVQRPEQNGKPDVDGDWRRSLDERVNDLLAQMSVEEKAGLMARPSLSAGANGSVSEQAAYGSNPFNPGPIQLRSPATSESVLRRQIRPFHQS